MPTKRDILLRFVMDVVENITKVKKKKLDREQIIRDAEMQLGLSADESHSLIEELLTRGILCNNEGSLAIDYKQRFELTKSLLNLLHDTPLPQRDGAQTKSTDEKRTSTEKTEHESRIADQIAFLGKSVHDELFSLKALMLNIPDARKSQTTPCPTKTPPDYERIFIHCMEDRILSLEKQLEQKQRTIEKLMETIKTFAKKQYITENSQECHTEKASQSAKESNSKSSSKENDTVENKTSIVYEDTESDVSKQIKALRKKQRKKKRNKKNSATEGPSQAIAQKNTITQNAAKNPSAAVPSPSSGTESITIESSSTTVPAPSSGTNKITGESVQQPGNGHGNRNPSSNSSNDTALSSHKSPLTNNNKVDDMQQQRSIADNNQMPSFPPSQSPATINNAENKTTSAADGKKQSNSRGKDNKTITSIVGDSMVKNVKGWKLRPRCNINEQIHVYDFPGATTRDMNSYSKPIVDKNPDNLILHCGTNELRTRKSEVEISTEIITLAKSIEARGIHVIVSGLIARGDNLEDKRLKTNFVLRDMCNEENLTFIDHENIQAERHLNRSRLHLNRFGDSVLADNFFNASRK